MGEQLALLDRFTNHSVQRLNRSGQISAQAALLSGKLLEPKAKVDVVFIHDPRRCRSFYFTISSVLHLSCRLGFGCEDLVFEARNYPRPKRPEGPTLMT
jgi:hypothetical protein